MTAGILPENLRFPAEGGLGVSLWNQWPAMLRELREVGKLLVITRNADAVLGHYRSYPELTFVGEEEHLAHGGGMAIDLEPWHRALAREEQHPNGYSYAVEIVDGRRNPIHKVCLTAESDFPRFLEWVQDHQAGMPMPSERPSAPLPASEVLFQPAPNLAEAARSLLQELMEREVEIRVAVGNQGLSQSHAFVFHEMREMGEWIFCADADAGCHFRPAAIAHFSLEQCGCGGSSWLRALNSRGETLFLMAATARTDLSVWTPLVREAANASG